jgi:hypothetical protein
MKRSTTTASPLYPKIRFAFTDHPITVWAGAILLRLYFELIGLRAGLRTTLARTQIPGACQTLEQSDSIEGLGFHHALRS